MSKKVNIEEACELLKSYNNIMVAFHRFPDGDAIGSAYALCMALRKLGKQARPVCVSEISERYSFFTDACMATTLAADERLVTVDVADYKLLGMELGQADLAIDHHTSHREFADNLLLCSTASAAEIVRKLIDGLGVEWDKNMANAIYTGICTDTGCFKFRNTTPETLRAAADMIELGADHSYINTLFFDTKSKLRIEVEKRVLNNIEYFEEGKIALVRIDEDILSLPGLCEDDLDGISALPRSIEGVDIGITLRKNNSGYKISVRASARADASAVCAECGGGGHKGAAGCTVETDFDDAKGIILAAAKKELSKLV